MKGFISVTTTKGKTLVNVCKIKTVESKDSGCILRFDNHATALISGRINGLIEDRQLNIPVQFADSAIYISESMETVSQLLEAAY